MNWQGKKRYSPAMFLGLFCVACSSHWQYSRVFYGSYSALWEEGKKAVERQGYVPYVCQKELRYLRSEWKTTLYPLRPGGYRTCVVLKFEIKNQLTENVLKEGEDIGFFQIKVKVLREVNHSTHDFMDPRHAVWLANGYDFNVEALLLQEIESGFYLKSEPNGASDDSTQDKESDEMEGDKSP